MVRHLVILWSAGQSPEWCSVHVLVHLHLSCLRVAALKVLPLWVGDMSASVHFEKKAFQSCDRANSYNRGDQRS